MSRLNSLVSARKERKLKLIELIQNLQPVEEQRLMGIFSLKTGLKFKTINEYLKELEAGGLIKREDGAVSMYLFKATDMGVEVSTE